MAHRDDHHRLFMVRPSAQPAQKLHRVGRMGQGGQPRVVQGGNQKAGGNANAFRDIVVFIPMPVMGQAVALGKDHNQPRGDVQMRF